MAAERGTGLSVANNSVTFMSHPFKNPHKMNYCANISGDLRAMIFFFDKVFRGGTVAQTVIMA